MCFMSFYFEAFGIFKLLCFTHVIEMQMLSCLKMFLNRVVVILDMFYECGFTIDAWQQKSVMQF